ncbi:MucB/RseB C-terminal domain-containing protein [Rivibacter subsaxonicus]|uniref:MucB/RseB-like sigma(E) regulatory protein n=1 Tax=Rivibacter subsaxonicus TaxID=457575 RepID=A0A4Q7VGU5_9BURK|nr:MucB/RseB C-terminal domain-containing protein [Rivibacter subsaxonicus]RZT95272.1 MucB/RseB-like sigma(E) regulatory protein [Rivibacter subsaxonicus]
MSKLALNAAPVQRERLWSALACVSAAWFTGAAPARAQTADPLVDAREARRWLSRMHEAAGRKSFQGIFVVSAGGAVSSSHIVHYCDGRNQYERIDSLDGQRRRVLRHNDTVLTLWPTSRVALLESREALGEFPSLLQSSADRIVRLYDARPLGADRVAGLDALVLQLQPRDAYRFGLRLWAEKNSGLLLRAEVLGDRDEVIESSAFSEVQIGIRSQPEQVLQAMRRLEGYRVERPVLDPTDLEREGWLTRQLPPGFVLSRSVKRVIDIEQPRPAAMGDADARATVLQSSFSDGLNHVSVFIEPFRPQRHKRELLMSMGATQTLALRHGDWWLTVIGDVPVLTLRAFAGALERRK